MTGDARNPRASGLLRTGVEAEESAGAWILVGLPYDGGIPTRPGARFGPDALRRMLSGYAATDGERELDPVEDAGDLALPSMNGAEAHRRIEEAAARLHASGRRVMAIGGDHGCTGSLIRGLAAARGESRLAVISLDAHLDVREYADDASLSSGTPFRRALETPVLEGGRVAMVGLRPFANSAAHLRWAREQGVHLFPVEAVERDGSEAVAGAALAAAAGDADALYLSVDLDAADVAWAPGVSAPGAGGLTAREMISLVAIIARDPRLIGVDLMELSPPYDIDDRTARLAARLLLEVLRACPIGG